MKICRIIVLGIFSLNVFVLEPRVVTFFFRPYPQMDQKAVEKLAQKLQSPGQISKYMLKSLYFANRYIEGICCSYLGYIAVSNAVGQILFPQKQIRSPFKLLITTKIIPIMMIGATVHHWEMSTTDPVAFYSLDYKHDSETGLYFWDVKKEEPPANKIIPLETIIIFADPQWIYVPEGATVVQKQLITYLPDLYVKKGINRFSRALWLLTVRHFLGPVKFEDKKISNTYYSKMIVN